MARNLHWQYSMYGTESKTLLLWDGVWLMGLMTVKRDDAGRITGGESLIYDCRMTNVIDFFDRVQTVQGLTREDRIHASKLAEGFFRIRRYTQSQHPSVVYFYEENAMKRSHYQRHLAYLHQRNSPVLEKMITKMCMNVEFRERVLHRWDQGGNEGSQNSLSEGSNEP